MDDRIRVLSVLNKLFLGGHENRLLTLAKTIDCDRFQHRIVTLTCDPVDSDEGRRAIGSLRPEFAAAGIDVEDLRLPARAGVVSAPFNFSRAVARLVRHIRKHRIQVIDAHHTVAMMAAAAAGRITGVPVIQTSYHTGVWQRTGMQQLGRRTLGSAAAIVTDSEFRAEEIRSWLNRPAVPVHVIPTGIPVPESSVTAKAVRRKLELPAEGRCRIVGQVSALVEFKGHLDLLEAAPAILREHPDVVFLCIGFSRGFDEYEQRLNSRIRELGLQDRFLLRGWPGSIGDVWQLFDVYVHPSRFDSLPLVVIEAMALAKPSVVTSVGGIPEFVEHERSGLVVPIEAPAEMAAATSRLLSNPQFGKELGAVARERYAEQLTPDAMTSSIERLYVDVAKRSARQENESGRAA